MEEEITDDTRPRRSLEFIEGSALSTVIPSANEINIEETFNISNERTRGQFDSPLAAVPQRQALFFGQ